MKRQTTCAIASGLGAAALLALASGCRGGGGASQKRGRVGGAIVTFLASDGVRLQGRVVGDGSTAAVLSHMGRGGDSASDWAPLARRLASEGLRVLVYNRRGTCARGGYGCSEGSDDLASSWRDVVGAYRCMRSSGAEKVILVGASIGAMSSLRAATQPGVRVAGLVEIGGINNASGYAFDREDIRRITAPKLFVSSAGDVYGGADAARTWYGWAEQPKEIAILPGRAHGTDMLRAGEPTRPRLTTLIAKFAREIADDARASALAPRPRSR